MGKRKQEKHPSKSAGFFRHDKTIVNTGVFSLVRGVFQIGIGVAKGNVPITATQGRELYSAASRGGKRFAFGAQVGSASTD